ncbi:hypothetical protein X403_01529 [Mycobacterium tuberculosis XTB13-197]|nr:hypothetical protein TBPG_002913 [Mycobacterium tuberculosis W-148]KAL42804.1 hypothetical protein X329_03685 [Mycobacterium tuberculosis XTB13-110]KAL51233.1 hypothetical protein X359_03725 [Mycobacterium tuberculosis XTB13-142]KAL58259.1 hypothetical protein X341_01476 [Mycobacterium tuberculosis XTB13-123]KAL60158.1 hypothetical protein X381_03433 [Mycobacterium tuberculosis XTB13-173]KAM16530.1 hypothetical protein Z551_03043 [Mycobacterium tuberculosis 2485AR]KAM56645.1 hypothetical p
MNRPGESGDSLI